MEIAQPGLENHAVSSADVERAVLVPDDKDTEILKKEIATYHWNIYTPTISQLQDVNWFYEPTGPSQIATRLLTDNGRQRKISSVVQMYYEKGSLLPTDFSNHIDDLVDFLGTGGKFRPLLLVRGRNPLTHTTYALDGNHRLLAYALWGKRNGITDFSVDAFLGRRFYPCEPHAR